jgi:hypothetical protein
MTYYNKLLYLESHNSKDGLKIFGFATRYDYYVLQKEKKNENIETKIKDEKKGIINKVNLLKYEWLPIYYLIIIMNHVVIYYLIVIHIKHEENGYQKKKTIK